MRRFCNLHASETCIVIGNGGSLRDVPRSFLEKYPTFGTNRIYLLQGFEPTYYVAVNPLVIKQCQDEINELKSHKFIADPQKELIPGSFGVVSGGEPRFGYDPTRELYEGFTVTFVALQLAFYMGFTTVLLVGLDHRYKYSGSSNEKQLFKGKDPNHFAPDYFTGKYWHTPDLEKSNEAYKMAEDAFRVNGRIVINLTPNSGTDIFERQELKSWV